MSEKYRTGRWKAGKWAAGLMSLCVGVFGFTRPVGAAEVTMKFQDAAGEGGSMNSLDIMLLFLFLAVVPSLVLMMTSFTRIIIVLSFLRNAMGTQQSPPNQILIGLALVLTFFIMSPVLGKVNTQAYQPYKSGEITREQAFEKAQEPMKEFMLKQTEKKSLDLFMSISKTELPDTSVEGPERYMELSLTVIVPSFVLSELNKAFTMGFLIFIPFLIIDLVVSSTLMSMGMVMLPPTMIALPFKIMMFVLVDGWDLVIKTLVQGFH
ncbi:Flagellar biosynthetic protein fliP precursor [uncultured Clostridium sp.]|nr:Flagellar biosynthetic protein fliP precursor [uncultured Clostridium sp.]